MTRSRRKGRAEGPGNPLSKTVKPPSDPELAALREKHILPIIADLSSPDIKKRISAAGAIQDIAPDTKCRKLLLREQVVRILMEQTITDPALESKCVGWGILRKLALEEDADFLIHLYRQDILPAVQVIIQMIIDTIQSHEHPISKLPNAQQNQVWILSSSVIGLISSLAEAHDDILEAISGFPIILQFLFGLLSLEPIPESLFIDTLSCLAILTEDNEIYTKKIVEHDSWLKRLMQIRELGDSEAVPACGVLHNIFSAMQWFDHNTPMEGVSDATLISTLIQYVHRAQTEPNFSNSLSRSNPDEILQLALEITASIATSLQQALEHANHNEKEFEGFEDNLDNAMVEDGSDIGESEDDTSDNEDMGEAEIDADMELVAGAEVIDNEDDSSTDSQPTLDALVRTATPAILSIVKALNDNRILRSSALSALNNIAWTVSSIDFVACPSNLGRIWAGLAQQIWDEVIAPVLVSNTADIDLASSIVGVAWAIARSLQGKIRLHGDEHRKFVALYQASKNIPTTTQNGHKNGDTKNSKEDSSDPFQGLGVKCIGVLGRLALDPAPVPLNREIGVFLLTILSALPDTPAADAIEALDQFLDIYADKSYACDAAVFWADGFDRHLEAIAPKAKKMAKSIDKRKHMELRQRADEVVSNLERFLVYKRREKSGRMS